MLAASSGAEQRGVEPTSTRRTARWSFTSGCATGARRRGLNWLRSRRCAGEARNCARSGKAWSSGITRPRVNLSGGREDAHLGRLRVQEAGSMNSATPQFSPDGKWQWTGTRLGAGGAGAGRPFLARRASGNGQTLSGFEPSLQLRQGPTP